MDDLTVDVIKTADTSTYDRAGVITRNREYVFFIGKFGPFTERIPLEPFDGTELQRRVDALKLHLMNLPR